MTENQIEPIIILINEILKIVRFLLFLEPFEERCFCLETNYYPVAHLLYNCQERRMLA